MARKSKGTLRRVGGYMAKDRRLAITAVVVMVLGSLALAFAPKLAGNLIDMLTEFVTDGYTHLDDGFLPLIAVIAGLYVFGYCATMVSNRNMIVVSRNATQRMRRNLHNKLNRIPIRFLDTHSSGDISSRLTNDLTTVESLRTEGHTR